MAKGRYKFQRVDLLRVDVKAATDKLRKALADIPTHPMRDKCFAAMIQVRNDLEAALEADTNRIGS